MEPQTHRQSSTLSAGAPARSTDTGSWGHGVTGISSSFLFFHWLGCVIRLRPFPPKKTPPPPCFERHFRLPEIHTSSAFVCFYSFSAFYPFDFFSFFLILCFYFIQPLATLDGRMAQPLRGAGTLQLCTLSPRASESTSCLKPLPLSPFPPPTMCALPLSQILVSIKKTPLSRAVRLSQQGAAPTLLKK